MQKSHELDNKTLFKSNLIDLSQKILLNIKNLEKKDDEKSNILKQFYTNIKCEDIIINLSELSSNILKLNNDNINQDYIEYTIKRKNINFDKGINFSNQLHLSKKEGYIKLKELDMKRILKSYRYFLNESCNNIKVDPNFNNQLMYKTNKSDTFVTCEKFISFGHNLIEINKKINLLSDNLIEINDYLKKLKNIEKKTIYVNKNDFLMNDDNWRNFNNNESLFEINNIELNDDSSNNEFLINLNEKEKIDDNEGWIKVTKKKKK